MSKPKNTSRKLTVAEHDALISTLQKRFEKNRPRHIGIKWADVEAKLERHPAKLWSLYQMEATEGEPDVVGYEKKTGEYVFYDCAPESPKGRRSLCYDLAAWESRKEHKPQDSAMEMASAMGIDMLSEDEYRSLQELGEFDLKTSSWVLTPPAIRKLGGAIFCDRRYGQVFTYHNGAESYYAARGFRAALRI